MNLVIYTSLYNGYGNGKAIVALVTKLTGINRDHRLTVPMSMPSCRIAFIA